MNHKQEINKVHLIFKTHLDVGFTDYAKNVVQQYMESYIPKAIDLGRILRENGRSERFIWTTGSWLIYEYLEKASAAERKKMEMAIAAGDIVWHGLPFTFHTEFMDASLFKYGLSLSQELDKRFGKKTISAKMTDVPGHTRAVIPLLAQAGIKFLHIGINPVAKAPDVPEVFMWKDPNQEELAVMYHKGSYGSYMELPGTQQAILFEHTNDNMGPQTEEEVINCYKTLKKRHNNAKITASDLNSFAGEVIKIKESLPVVHEEIGDTWIQGVGADPWKASHFREISRIIKNRKGENPEVEKDVSEVYRSLIMVPEHTWGMDIKMHLNDFESYRKGDFLRARDRESFKKVELSWCEQREYISNAVKEIESPALKKTIHKALKELIPAAPDLSGYERVKRSDQVFDTANYIIGFNGYGAISLLQNKINGRLLANSEHTLAQLSYQSFSQANYDRYLRQYMLYIAEWAVQDNSKPGLTSDMAEAASFSPKLIDIWRCRKDRTDSFILELEFDNHCSIKYGAPGKIFFEVELFEQSTELSLKLSWFKKPANRLPEALWLSFRPLLEQPELWKMRKMGQLISPADVISNGNRHLHAIEDEIIYETNKMSLTINSMDAPLVAPGVPSLLDFTNKLPDLDKGMHFNLYNNTWGTNFPMWYEQDALFRFKLNNL